MDILSLTRRADAVMKRFYGEDAPGAALLAIQGGKMIIEKGYGLADTAMRKHITPSTNFRMASVSKQFTALCIVLLAARQKISLHDPVSKYLRLHPAAIKAVTIHQLLVHTSGLADYETLIPPDREVQLRDEDVLQVIREKGNVYFTPGAKFKYSNTGYCLLALIVAQVSGMPFSAFVRKNIFSPLKMDGSQVCRERIKIPRRAYGYHPDGGGYHFADQGITSATQGDGGVYTSLRDYLKWHEALMNNVLLSKERMNSLFFAHTPVKDGTGYGYGWFTGEEKDGTACRFHSGESTGFRNMVYCNPVKRLLIAVFSNRDDDVIAKVFDEVAGMMGVQANFPSASNLSLVNWLSGVYGN